MIDLSKSYTTRGWSGGRGRRPVKVFMIDAGGAQPVIGAALEETLSDDGEVVGHHWEPASWSAEGLFDPKRGRCSLDLVEVSAATAQATE